MTPAAKKHAAILVKTWRAHAKRYAPSGSDRWLNCSGSVLAIEAVGDTDSGGQSADEGTAAHAVFEACLVSGLKAREFVGMKAGPDTNLLDVDEEMSLNVQSAVDYIHETHRGPEGVKTEWEVSIPTTGDRGHIDAAVIAADTIHVFDYKNGRGWVDVERNPQAMLYAIGVLKTIPMAQRAKIRSVVLHILQPRTIPPMRKWETTPAELYKFHAEARARIAAAESPGAPRTAGSWCKWCPIRGNCAELAHHTAKAAGVEFADLVKPAPFAMVSGDPVAKPLPTVDPQELTPAQFRNAYSHLGAIETWVKAMKAEAVLRLRHGLGEGLGLKLVYSRSSRKWVSEANAMEALHRVGLKADEFAPRALVGIGAAEDLLKDAGLKPEARADLMTKLTTKPPGFPVAAPLSDTRQEVKANAAHDFRDLLPPDED